MLRKLYIYNFMLQSTHFRQTLWGNSFHDDQWAPRNELCFCAFAASTRAPAPQRRRSGETHINIRQSYKVVSERARHRRDYRRHAVHHLPLYSQSSWKYPLCCTKPYILYTDKKNSIHRHRRCRCSRLGVYYIYIYLNSRLWLLSRQIWMAICRERIHKPQNDCLPRGAVQLPEVRRGQ